MPLSTEPFAPAMCSQCSGTLHVIGKGWACGQCGLPVDEPKSQPVPVAAVPSGAADQQPKRGRKAKV